MLIRELIKDSEACEKLKKLRDELSEKEKKNGTYIEVEKAIKEKCS